MMNRVFVLAFVVGMLAATMGVGLAQDGLPEHPHMLVQRPEFGFVDGVPAVLGWRKCVDLAAGQTVPLNAHHANLHFGTAGVALFEKAGHAVVPGSPLTPWANCAELAADLPILLE